MNAPQLIHHQHIEPDTAPGLHLARLAIARARATRDHCSVVPVTQQLFPNDSAALAIARAVSGVADTSTTAWAAALLRSDVRMLMADIAPISATAKLASLGTSVSFNGAKAVFVSALPLTDARWQPAWVAEGGVIPVLQGGVGGARVERYKLGDIVVVSKELENPDALEAMRQLLRRALSSLLDRSLVDALPAVAGVRPAGLLNGVTVTAGASGGGLPAMAADVQTMLTKMLAAGVGSSSVVFILNTATAAAVSVLTHGTFGGLTVVGIPHVAADVAIAADAAFFASGIEPPELETSEVATLTMADAGAAAPTQAMNAAGALGTAEQVLPDRGISVAGGTTGAASVGAQAASNWQGWSLALRLVVPCGFATLLPGSVQAVNAITWAAPTP